jgi:hypothetical protein
MTRSIPAELDLCYEIEQVTLLVYYGADTFSSNWNRMVE